MTDIYICYSASTLMKIGTNILYLNNGTDRLHLDNESSIII